MSVTSGFFNSLNGDRKYNAEQMSSLFDGIISDGIFATVGETLMTVPGTGMQVIVKSGRAWFNHTWTYNNASLPLGIEAASAVETRYDAVVLEVNTGADIRQNRIFIKRGAAATPAMANTETCHQYPLAWIRVRSGATDIRSDDITVCVGTGACPFVVGAVTTVNIENLFAQWNGEFTTWFAGLQAQLSGNVVANLNSRIDSLAAFTTSKIGELKYTMRTDLSNSWALANGALIPNSSEYAEIRPLADPTMMYKYNRKSVRALPFSHSVIANPDYYYQYRDLFATDGTIYATAMGNPGTGISVWYTTDFITWNNVVVSVGDYITSTGGIPKMSYNPILHKWVIVYTYSVTSASKRYFGIVSLSSNSLNSTWQTSTVHSGSSSNTPPACSVKSFGFCGDRFVLCYIHTTSTGITGVKCSEDGLYWTEVCNLNAENMPGSKDIKCYEGTFYTISAWQTNSVPHIYLEYSNDNFSTVSHVALSNLESIFGDIVASYSLIDIERINGVFYLFTDRGLFKALGPLGNNPNFVKINDIDFSIRVTSGVSHFPLLLVLQYEFDGNRVILHNGKYIFEGPNIESLTLKDSMESNVFTVRKIDGRIQIIGINGSSCTRFIDGHYLPIITADGARVYIKTKEETF